MLFRGPVLTLALALGLALGPRAARADETALVAAASDLRFAVEDLAQAFRDKTGDEVMVTFGSTGMLATQIREGAPFDLFMAADESFVFDLAEGGFLQDQGVVYSIGRLVLFVPQGSALKADASLDDLALALTDGRLRRLAIASPEHAPYGMRAEDILRRKGLWQAIQPHLVLGENIAQAAQFAASGNADAGIIAYALSLSPELAARGTSVLLPEDWHRPLMQRMALTPGAHPAARAFYDYLQTPEARAILVRHGFALPGGEQG